MRLMALAIVLGCGCERAERSPVVKPPPPASATATAAAAPARIGGVSKDAALDALRSFCTRVVADDAGRAGIWQVTCSGTDFNVVLEDDRIEVGIVLELAGSLSEEDASRWLDAGAKADEPHYFSDGTTVYAGFSRSLDDLTAATLKDRVEKNVELAKRFRSARSSK